jgi:hypothetical protein
MARRPSKQDEFRIMETCAMCGSSFQFGPHIYDGKFIAAYQISVCRSCFESNWDGWAPHYEARLEAHLKAKGIPLPNRNAEGFYPRGA